jgi:hypothetical protein
MRQLPGAQWSEETVTNRLRFLLNCAENVRELTTLLGSRQRETRERPAEPRRGEGPTDAENANIADCFSEAAEIAFSTDRLEIGLDRLRSAIGAVDASRSDVISLARAALYSALVNDGAIRISTTGLQITLLNQERADRPWTQLGNMRQIAQALPILVTAALLRGSADELAPILFPDEVENDARMLRTMLAAFAAPEFAVLGLFGISRRGSRFSIAYDNPPDSMLGGQSALLEMERNYEDRIQFERSDESHWEALRVHGGLIEWRLLAIHVALVRRERLDAINELPAMFETSEFIRALAREIAQISGQARGRL